MNNMNGARIIASNLKILRDSLQNVESQINKEIKIINTREDNNKYSDERLIEIINLQKNIINFNVSGKLCPVNKIMILECEYDNFLTQICKTIIKDYGEENLNDRLENYLIDRNRKYFRCIIDLLRLKYHLKLHNSVGQRIEYYIKLNPNLFKEEIEYYFNGSSYDKIFKDFNLFYNDNKEIRLLYGKNMNINDLLIEFTLTSKYPDDRLEPFTANTIDDINNIDSFKAIFANFDSVLLFKFADYIKASCIELRPFWGDYEVWYSGNGAECPIYYSRDGNIWSELGIVPIDYGFDALCFIEFKEVEFKYVKFDVKNMALSISYIKFA